MLFTIKTLNFSFSSEHSGYSQVAICLRPLNKTLSFNSKKKKKIIKCLFMAAKMFRSKWKGFWAKGNVQESHLSPGSEQIVKSTVPQCRTTVHEQLCCNPLLPETARGLSQCHWPWGGKPGHWSLRARTCSKTRLPDKVTFIKSFNMLSLPQLGG